MNAMKINSIIFMLCVCFVMMTGLFTGLCLQAWKCFVSILKSRHGDSPSYGFDLSDVSGALTENIVAWT